MRMVSLLPEDSIERLRERFGGEVNELTPLELQALVTAELDGGVSNSRMQQVSSQHPSDLTRLLQGLASRNLLEQQGHKRWTTYRLGPPQTVESESLHTAGDSQQSTEGSQHIVLDSQQSLSELPSEELERLRDVASRSTPGSHLRRAETQSIILELCTGRYLTRHVLAQLVNRNPDALRNRFLVPMVREGLLQYRFPDEPNRPAQSYTTAER
jgi:ATP-dependent DNA helicase RecG